MRKESLLITLKSILKASSTTTSFYFLCCFFFFPPICKTDSCSRSYFVIARSILPSVIFLVMSSLANSLFIVFSTSRRDCSFYSPSPFKTFCLLKYAIKCSHVSISFSYGLGRSRSCSLISSIRLSLYCSRITFFSLVYLIHSAYFYS